MVFGISKSSIGFFSKLWYDNLKIGSREKGSNPSEVKGVMTPLERTGRGYLENLVADTFKRPISSQRCNHKTPVSILFSLQYPYFTNNRLTRFER